MNDDLIWIPSGKQTWRAGKWTIEIGDVPTVSKPPFIWNFPASHV